MIDPREYIKGEVSSEGPYDYVCESSNCFEFSNKEFHDYVMETGCFSIGGDDHIYVNKFTGEPFLGAEIGFDVAQDFDEGCYVKDWKPKEQR